FLFMCLFFFFFFSSRRRHTRWPRDWSSDVYSSDLETLGHHGRRAENLFIVEADRDVAVVGRREALGIKPPADLADLFFELEFVRSEERRVGKDCICWRGREQYRERDGIECMRISLH